MVYVVLPIKFEVSYDTQAIKAKCDIKEELAVSSGFIPTA